MSFMRDPNESEANWLKVVFDEKGNQVPAMGADLSGLIDMPHGRSRLLDKMFRTPGFYWFVFESDHVDCPYGDAFLIKITKVETQRPLFFWRTFMDTRANYRMYSGATPERLITAYDDSVGYLWDGILFPRMPQSVRDFVMKHVPSRTA